MATKGKVTGVIANMVLLAVDGPVAQNEICYIKTGGDRLMAEVIKINGAKVYVQVFESTRRLRIGEASPVVSEIKEFVIMSSASIASFLYSGVIYFIIHSPFRLVLGNT